MTGCLSKRQTRWLLALCLAAAAPSARAEVILQYFQMSWRDLAQKMPELAEAGYTALWLPPPTKGSGGLSTGYDLWDPFDLGGRNQRDTVRTRYGTEAELLDLVRTAHRFGIRVYFDTIMNHRAFDIPGYNETTPIDLYPGMRPEDFHLRITEDGFYRKWPDMNQRGDAAWQDAWQVQHVNFSDLIDIAHENPNQNFGATEGSWHPKLTFLRHPDNPEFYCYLPGAPGTSHAAFNGAYVGFGPSNGITRQILQDNAWFYSEDVGAYLIRAARWQMAHTKADGLRLDAVKHVPAYFFGQQFGDKDGSDLGFAGGVQRQFNLSRGFADWSNHRDSLFDINIPRDDAMLFGEHLAEPPGFTPYIDAGIRLKDAPLRNRLNDFLGEPWGSLSGLDAPGWSGSLAMNENTAVSFVQSHDSDFAKRRELQYAYIMTRAGLPIIYTDGYFKAGTLGASGGAFPRHANAAFLGQFGDPRLPNLAYLREHFARGSQTPHWSDGDVVAYSRVDKRREGWGDPAGLYKSISDAEGAVMLFLMNDNYAAGQPRTFTTAFPAGAYLYQYARGPAAEGDAMTGFYITLGNDGNGYGVYPGNTIPRGGYFAFSWRSPEASQLWSGCGGNTITLYDNGVVPGTVRVTRRDGPDGDASFNPLGLANRGFPAGETPQPFRYQVEIPRITSGTNLRFAVRVDGSAADVLMKLNGGADLNSQMGFSGHFSGGNRDRPPQWVTDTFLGWENTRFVKRIHREKYAAKNTARNTIGCFGAETYVATVGSAGFTINNGAGSNDWDGSDGAVWIYHDPALLDQQSNRQFSPLPENAANQPVTLRVKVGYQFHINRMWIYYTTNGVAWPEGAGGEGYGTTRVAPLQWYANGPNDGSGIPDWWRVTLPAMPAGTVLRYKISGFREQGSDGVPYEVVFPSSAANVTRKSTLLGVWEVTNFNAKTVTHYPDNDWTGMTTGLVEGLNFLQARAFLQRDPAAPIYNTFKQTFYLDLQRPQGEVVFPVQNATLGSQEYGVVVRTDTTVTGVWFNIVDADPGNDDGATSVLNGNGTNVAGQASWAQATEVVPTLEITNTHPREWRFTYRGIPSSGAATLRVRLLELSSSTNMALADASGHFTTLERQTQAGAPAQRLFVAYPTQDGDLVSQGYVLKAYFSKSLADNTSFEQLRDRFTLFLNNLAQGKDFYGINYDETPEYHALTFTLPNLFNGNPDFLHQIEVRHLTGNDVLLTSFRQVRAVPTEIAPQLQIVQPLQYDSNGRATEIVLRDVPSPSPQDRQYQIEVHTELSVRNVWIEFLDGRGNAPRVAGPVTNGTSAAWTFLWTNMTAGTFTFSAHGNAVDDTTNTISVTDVRTLPVLLREEVALDGSGDSDNDGIPDTLEVERVPLPETDSEFWSNGDVHIWRITGRTNPQRPSTDGSGLPDGLQLGLSSPIQPSATDTNADTNADGFPNFIADVDPPIFNVLGNSQHPLYNFNRSRTDQLSGSMTDPARPDTDADGLYDRFEDANRNGRVEVGLLSAAGTVTNVLRGWNIANPSAPYLPTVYNTSQVDRDALPLNARFLETDPNLQDTIGDGLLDGQSDANGNGRVDLLLLWPEGTTSVLNLSLPENHVYLLGMTPADKAALAAAGQSNILSRAIHYTALFAAFGRPVYDSQTQTWSGTNVWPRVLFQETDPLVKDTNGDGLPDGWKTRYGLDPLDDGWYNLRTGEMHETNSQQGADGDLTGDGFTNYDHFLNGTDPRVPITGTPPPAGAIILGPGTQLGTLNGVARNQEFMEWTWADVRAIDAYEGSGGNNQDGDIYPANDGWDASRDLVAFYARDGGDPLLAGDGRLYFRLDLHDLQAFAEQGNVDFYIAINFGDTLGERVLPDQIDTLTDMRWRAVVAVYESALGTVYVDGNPAQNTTTFGQDLVAFGGVESRPQAFLGAYFNSELDAIELAIDRQAVLDAGWLGADPGDLRFQVYVVRSGTGNSPPGAGDIGGRSDIRDSIYNDSIAEDYGDAQAGLRGTGSVLRDWIPGDRRTGRVKVALVLHGNQQVEPGSVVQNLINNGAGAGYYRALDAHAIYGAPLNLHLTPTLASAIEWARADPAAAQPWRDGPAFNDRLSDLMQDDIVSLFATTFSDSILPFFTLAYAQDSAQLARVFLETIYGVNLSDRRVFFPPERVLNRNALEMIAGLGYDHTLLDQMLHLRRWFGREAALSREGYSVNRIHGVRTFGINDQISGLIFQAHDQGAAMGLRRQLNRMARSFAQDQVLVLYSYWESFGDKAQADAYDATLRWMVNRPWIEIVSLEDIAAGNVDLDGDGDGDAFTPIERGQPSTPTTSHDWIHYATREDYDHWYFGEPTFREGLAPRVFSVRSGTPVPQPYGSLSGGGIVSNAWAAVQSVTRPDLQPLARGALHASTFVTAFHNQDSVNLAKFSTGAYIEPDTAYRTLAAFARNAHAQTRKAALFARVQAWADSAAGLSNAVAQAQDIDLDGEDEYLMYNRRLFAVLERSGGRMIAAWARHVEDGRVFQVVGNLVGYAGADTEDEGNDNASASGQVLAYRTSALKDWWAGSAEFVNKLYTFTNWTNGWRAVSSDGKITKTVTLQPDGTWLDVAYNVTPALNGGRLFVRSGLSPDLLGLLLHGQERLTSEIHAGGVMTLKQVHPGDISVVAKVAYAAPGYNTGFNAAAVDDNPGLGVNFTTVNMRNQAQTHQVELVGTNAFRFALGFEVLADTGELFNDGVPYSWLEFYGYDPETVVVSVELADNQVNSLKEAYIAGLNPRDPTAFFGFSGTRVEPEGVWIRFETSAGRRYFVWYANHSLVDATWTRANTNAIVGDGTVAEWLDDGQQTSPHPGDPALRQRSYRMEVLLP